MKNKSLMKIEINPHCRWSRGSGVKAGRPFSDLKTLFSLVFIFPLMSLRMDYFDPSLKSKKRCFVSEQVFDIFICEKYRKIRKKNKRLCVERLKNYVIVVNAQI